MTEINEYYVVGLYANPDEPPYKIYKVTTNIEEAIRIYGIHILNPKCFVGHYVNNKLIDLGQFRSFSVDGPGIFSTAVTKEMINDYQTD